MNSVMKSLVTAIAITAGLTQAAAAATFIVNGSFEATSPGASYDTLGAGSSAITGWTIDSGTVDFIGSYWQAADGSNSIDMAGNSLGAISQLITGLTGGVKYMITFAMSGNPDTSPTGPKFMTVNAGGETGTYAYDVAANGSTRTDMKWDDYQFFFTASGTSELLTFAALTSPTTGCCWGPALDNVRIDMAAVPLPASAPLVLAGLGALAALRRRRRCA